MNNEAIRTAIRVILREIEGSDKLRPGLIDTPERVQRTYEELFDGYNIDTSKLLAKTFEDEGKDQIAAVRDIKFWSTCEHHLLPFSGCAHVAYLPKNRVVGASKLSRLVLAYAHRLQLQERMTRQIADDIMNYLNPLGVAVVIHGEHLCMRCRGVKSPESQLVTSVMLGQFREDQGLRMEVLSLLGLSD